MHRLRDDEGGVSAEFAIVLPVLLLIVGVILGAIMLSATRITLVSAAHDIARLEARGDTQLAVNRKLAVPQGATVSNTVHDGILCTTVDASPGTGILSRIVISGTGCAAVSGLQ